jgi:hypothetical protein
VADTEKMKEMILDWFKEVEDMTSPMTASDEAKAKILTNTARARKLRTRLWGDAIQPRTRIVHYNQ